MQDTAGLMEEIRRLKKEKNAFVMAHNYMAADVQDAADVVADSLGMARKAVGVEADRLVVCGVYFMAETAAILNPQKTILIPDNKAGCPLANFATAEQVRQYRERYPDHAFIAYVNSSAEVKAEVDICCTSANAVAVAESVPQKKIVFLPDKNLGAYVQSQLPHKQIVNWPGYCVVHETADPAAVAEAREKYPGARTLIHPECPPDFWPMADALLSTGQMFTDVENHPEVKQFIIVTEWGIKHSLQKKYPDKLFIEPGKRLECQNMKKITLEKLALALREDRYAVTVPEEVAARARVAIERMLAVRA